MKKMVKTLLGKERGIAVSTLKEIADEAGLNPTDKGRFVNFALSWYNLNGKKLWGDICYGLEWADRFKRKREYSKADYDRLALLVKVDGKREAQNRLAKQVSSYYPFYALSHAKNKPAKEQAKATLDLALIKAQ